jgi:hypothetical protein
MLRPNSCSLRLRNQTRTHASDEAIATNQEKYPQANPLSRETMGATMAVLMDEPNPPIDSVHKTVPSTKRF